MTQWYYADAQRQRQGPVDTDTLRRRLSQGIIDRSSLVWREGLAQWVALHEVAAELGLDSAVWARPRPAGRRLRMCRAKRHCRLRIPATAPQPPRRQLRPHSHTTTLRRHRRGRRQ